MAPDARLSDVTISTLNAHGDLSAPPGSRPWAIAVRRELQSAIDNRESDTMNLKRFLLLMEQHEGYKVLTDARGRPFRSYRAFCEARHPIGLGYDPEMLQLVIAERKTAEQRATATTELREHRRPTIEEASNKGNNITFTRGTNPEYLAARIARDRPDILERMKAGEYPSVRAAAIEAGIVKVPTALDTLRKAWTKASADERATFLREATA